jgi:hypothetical protein
MTRYYCDSVYLPRSRLNRELQFYTALNPRAQGQRRKGQRFIPAELIRLPIQ